MPITFVAAGTVALNDAAATTLNVPYPAGIVAGDVIAMPVGVNSATLPTIPSGWLAGGVSSTSGGSTPSERIILKVCTGAESGSVAVTTASATSRAQMLLFRGVDNTTPLDNAGSVTASATATATYALPSMTTTLPGAALILIGVANAPGGTWTSPTSPGTFVETAETTGAIPSMGVQYLIWSGSGATGTVNYGRSTSVRGCTGMLALRPAVTSTSYAAAGSSAVTSAATGVAAAVMLAAGVASIVSGSTGAATRVPRTYAASGTAAVVSATSGTTTAQLGTSGSSAATSAASGAATSLLPTTGSAAATTTAAGSAALIGGAQSYPASGTAAVVSTATGSAAARYGVTGAAALASGTGASASARYGATGIAAIASGTTASVAARLAARGASSVTTGAGGSGTALYVVGGSSPLVSTSTGEILALIGASGAASVVSDSTGSANPTAPPSEFEGRILAARISAPLAVAELDIADTTSTIHAVGTTGRLKIPTATGVLT